MQAKCVSHFCQVDILVANEYFGYGEPDYSALKSNKGKWVVEVQSDG